MGMEAAAEEMVASEPEERDEGKGAAMEDEDEDERKCRICFDDVRALPARTPDTLPEMTLQVEKGTFA